ncbi:hypothetical protein ZIOFF_065463 [Zingiber officinale]|uniref:Uncharacterized protein n=1 Tax=Zingiber officinale TaxID=94328 RepID=A0A8J5EX62_ZINOF|nr:hypothetical protein ZIOFF_065463 [Zingiber officinale]
MAMTMVMNESLERCAGMLVPLSFPLPYTPNLVMTRRLAGHEEVGWLPGSEVGWPLRMVLGTRSGYIRGLGSGPKPVRSTSSDATSSSRSTNAALRERLESTQDELANTKIQLANTQDELASIKSRQNMFEQILNRLAPRALDSLIQDSSSAPPLPPPS